MKFLPRMVILVSVIAPPLAAAEAPPGPLDLRFKADERAAWTAEEKVPGKPSLIFGESGLQFTSEGLDVLTREWRIGPSPFEIAADLEMTRGRTEQFNRARGLTITLTTAPISAMEKHDTALILAVTQTGVILTAKTGGARLGAERRPGIWYFPGQEIAGVLKTSMGGQGGQDFSVRWPTKTLAGTRIRLWASRDADGSLHLKIFHADGASAPWWEATIPEKLAGADFRWLTIHTGREAADFQDPARFSLAAGQGSGPADGVLTRLQLRALNDGRPQLAQSFPPAVLPSDRPAKSRLLTPETLKSLRARFASPAFADYRTVVLRTAAPEAIAAAKMGQPDQNEAVFALAWALVLTGDKAKYLPPLLEHVDALIGPSDIYPKETFEFPGQLRQNLFIREFWVQNMAALALAYDLVGEELGRERRDRIRFLLVRMMKSYHALLDDGDWWFGENPSNTIGVGNGCLGLIAVVLREEQPQLAEKTLARALGNIRKLFLGVEEDGGCIEGAMYWNYGLCYPMLLGWSLRQTTGSDEGLLASPQVKNATRYLAVNFGGDNKMIPFNDNQPWLVGWPVLAAAGTEADDPLARWMADHMAKEYANGTPEREQARSTYSIPAFLYRDTVPGPKKFPGLPNVALLESVNEAVLRSHGTELIPGMVTGVKGKGTLSTHHANEDQSSFVLYADGELFLLDPGYFEQTAQKHSLPLIGDPEKMTLSATTPAALSGAWESGTLRSITVDATDAYNKSAKSPAVAERARRVFVQVGEKALIILDETIPHDPALPITAQFQVGVPVTATANTATLQGKNTRLTLSLFGPETGLVSKENTFKKNWIYQRNGTPWTTLRAEYHSDPARPLVSVLHKHSTMPEVRYEGENILVILPEEKPVRFSKTPNGWIAQK